MDTRAPKPFSIGTRKSDYKLGSGEDKLPETQKPQQICLLKTKFSKISQGQFKV